MSTPCSSIRRVAKSLIKVGLQRKDVVGIIGFNSPEYFFTFHGCWMADCVSTGIYTTNNPAACKYVLKNSNAKICVCEGGKQAEKIMSIAHQLPNLSTIVVYGSLSPFQLIAIGQKRECLR